MNFDDEVNKQEGGRTFYEIYGGELKDTTAGYSMTKGDPDTWAGDDLFKGVFQSRLMSFVESSFNTLTGLIVSFSAWMIVVAPAIGHPGDYFEGAWTTVFFSVLSLARSYLFRRFFNSHKLVSRIFKGW